MTGPSFITVRGKEAVLLILSLLKKKSTKQPTGFHLSTRALRKILVKHFDCDPVGVSKIAGFVVDALVARGILKGFNKTVHREVFRVNADSARDLLEETVTATYF